jgi:hypothetical protein
MKLAAVIARGDHRRQLHSMCRARKRAKQFAYCVKLSEYLEESIYFYELFFYNAAKSHTIN